MSQNSILEINAVEQSFRVGFWMKQTQVLHGVTFQVPKNSIFGFLGPNGAGKTTLIHLITGLRRPIAGSVKVCGFDAAELDARSRMGYLPERPYFHDHLTGEGFLKYMGSLSGLTGREIEARIPEALGLVGLSHARKLELRRFSKGMLQRVGIAQAILHDPELLVLDEPMSGLDPLGRKDIRELITKLASQGKTIFFSTHIIPDVEAICDQVAVIQKGRLVGCGPISQFLAQGPLQTEIAFGGLGDAQLKEMGKSGQKFQPLPQGAKTVVSGDQVDPFLRQLLEKKAHVLWVQPIRPSLESLFQTGESTEVLAKHQTRGRDLKE